MDFSIEIVSRNLATMPNFVGFLGGRDFTFFEVWGCRMTHGKVRGCHMAPQECDTWH